MISEHFYINNNFGSFYRGILNWFSDDFYPFKYKVISTYDKAVEYFNKQLQEGKEIDAQILPAITLDPSGEFMPEERGGKFLWQYPNLYPNFAPKVSRVRNYGQDPKTLYIDDNIIITPCFSRFQGSCEILFWLNSVYEYLDFRTKLFMWSGGLERWLRPELFWSYITLPDELIDLEYSNDYSGEKYKIDWRATKSVMTLIKNIDQLKTVYPILLTPQFKFTSISDNSEKYGGDNLSTWKLSATINYEIEIPTFLHVQTDWQIRRIHLNISMGENSYTKYGTEPPLNTIKKLSKNGLTNLSSFDIYRVKLDEQIESNIIIHDLLLKSFPDSTMSITWNPIVTGRLKIINSSADWNDVEEDDIILSNIFNNDVLSKLRISKGFISLTNNNNYILSKADLLWKPVLYGLDSTQISEIRTWDEKEITLDPYTKTIWKGKRTTQKLDEYEIGYGCDILSNIQDYINVDSGSTPMDQFSILFYDNTTERLEIRSFTNRYIYEFTNDDLKLDTNVYVTISLPEVLHDIDNLILVSYSGQLDYGVHYTIDLTQQLIILKIPAKESELVELFYYH